MQSLSRGRRMSTRDITFPWVGETALSNHTVALCARQSSLPALAIHSDRIANGRCALGGCFNAFVVAEPDFLLNALSGQCLGSHHKRQLCHAKVVANVHHRLKPTRSPDLVRAATQQLRVHCLGAKHITASSDVVLF